MAENILEAPIDYVTVYQNEADVVRKGKIKLQPGKRTIVLPDISNKINQDSVRVTGVGYGSIINVDIETILTEKELNPEIEGYCKNLKN